jgi:hypothetical protein
VDPFLLAAIEEAERGLSEGGIPIGSVLVNSGAIAGRGHNRRVQRGRAILHGEMDAIEKAGRRSHTPGPAPHRVPGRRKRSLHPIGSLVGGARERRRDGRGMRESPLPYLAGRTCAHLYPRAGTQGTRAHRSHAISDRLARAGEGVRCAGLQRAHRRRTCRRVRARVCGAHSQSDRDGARPMSTNVTSNGQFHRSVNGVTALAVARR